MHQLPLLNLILKFKFNLKLNLKLLLNLLKMEMMNSMNLWLRNFSLKLLMPFHQNLPLALINKKLRLTRTVLFFTQKHQIRL